MISSKYRVGQIVKVKTAFALISLTMGLIVLTTLDHFTTTALGAAYPEVIAEKRTVS